VYELSKNSDIQEKLYNEVEETHKSLNGKTLTYEVLQNMKYMDIVISETLRCWPPAPGLDRVSLVKNESLKSSKYVVSRSQIYCLLRRETTYFELLRPSFSPGEVVDVNGFGKFGMEMSESYRLGIGMSEQFTHIVGHSAIG